MRAGKLTGAPACLTSSQRPIKPRRLKNDQKCGTDKSRENGRCRPRLLPSGGCTKTWAAFGGWLAAFGAAAFRRQAIEPITASFAQKIRLGRDTRQGSRH